MCALAGEEPDKVPFAEHQIDSKVLTALFGEDKASDPVWVADALGLDILTFTLVPPLFAEKVVFPDGREHLVKGKLHTRDDLGLLDSLKGPTDPALYRELDALVARRSGRAIVGKTRLGLSAMLMSMDLEGFSMALADDPDLIGIVLKRYLGWFICAAGEMKKRGADLIWCFDDFAYRSGPMMSPTVFRERILPPLRQVTPDIPLPWIFHSDGDLRPVLKDLLGLGMSGLHPIEPECMSLAELKKEIGNDICLIGNVSVDILSRGTAEETRREVTRCFADGAPGGGYMISSSNSIPSYALPENVRVMADEIECQRK